MGLWGSSIALLGLFWFKENVTTEASNLLGWFLGLIRWVCGLKVESFGKCGA
ncbi:hypothetical protein RchiOBHm_Chr4g0441881 [Rosa chinensis]|uniref:Uncharacterized protein n=1 Tax=Rosa chinensis TaxID=74649 RepID=A0A2P6R3E3_ROSCH|nr:hypothetical protein RchiOBHm_Chr4g0441881 [Rosa chinensis]